MTKLSKKANINKQLVKQNSRLSETLVAEIKFKNNKHKNHAVLLNKKKCYKIRTKVFVSKRKIESL